MARLVNKQTIEVIGDYEVREINHFVLENPTSNFKTVTVKKDRVCKKCLSQIKEKTKCYTINSKDEGRFWVCFDCYPEPETIEEKVVGEHRLFYSEVTDNWGRHKSYFECEVSEIDDFEAKKHFKILGEIEEF